MKERHMASIFVVKNDLIISNVKNDKFILVP